MDAVSHQSPHAYNTVRRLVSQYMSHHMQHIVVCSGLFRNNRIGDMAASQRGEKVDRPALNRIVKEAGSISAAALYLGIHRGTLHRALQGARVATWVADRIRGPVPPVPVVEAQP